MTNEQFVKAVAGSVAKYASQYGIACHSAVIAQFCLESGYGTSDKVYKNGEWRHNYAGLKWRNGRCDCTNNYFSEWTAEQNKDGSYTNIESRFFKFDSLDQCVLGYFQWINIPNYSNLKGVSEPERYLTLIKQDKYATSLNYVQKCMAVVKKWNLTQYDIADKKYYRVQVGAYSSSANAEAMAVKLQKAGFNCIIKQVEGLYKCQTGAFSEAKNAKDMLMRVKAKGFSAFVTFM